MPGKVGELPSALRGDRQALSQTGD